MLFNSIQFIFVFLPVFLLGFFILGASGRHRGAMLWALGGSLVFYGWDDPKRLLPLIVASATFNFLIGRGLARKKHRWLLAFGVTVDLALLGYFKYAEFLLEDIGRLAGHHFPKLDIPLPIGISFYTFTQIAFLVDAYRHQAREYEPAKYGLFVTFFPHLIAGPILHHSEMMPQFSNPKTFRPQWNLIAQGMTWFTFGLFKKVMLADPISSFVTAPFAAANSGPVGMVDSWTGALSYSLQIYFDFSGYSDMAIGLALLMGIKFPLNFNSPYKAESIIEFWRRWHMTLSRFLRDYLYFPLGGNKKGPVRRHINLFVTMVLGGLWHGATWNFVVWGAIHGVALFCNHLWRDISNRSQLLIHAGGSWVLTLLVVVFAWVPFRADNLHSALRLWKSMAGFTRGAVTDTANPMPALLSIFVLFCIAIFAPNTQQILHWNEGLQSSPIGWRPNRWWAVTTGCVFGICVAGILTRPTTFLYFRF